MTEQTNVSLNLNTISNAVTIIGICCQRGAFKPEEMEEVGKVYNQMKNFIQVAKEQEQEQEQEESTPTPESEEKVV